MGPASTKPVTAAELASVRAHVEAAEPAFLADLERLVNLDCGSYTRDGVNQVATWVADFLARLGGVALTVPGLVIAHGDLDLDRRLEAEEVRAFQEADLDETHGGARITNGAGPGGAIFGWRDSSPADPEPHRLGPWGPPPQNR